MADEAQNSGSSEPETDEQAIQKLIQLRKRQLGALNKIMSSISKPSDSASTQRNEKTLPHGNRKKNKP